MALLDGVTKYKVTVITHADGLSARKYLGRCGGCFCTFYTGKNDFFTYRAGAVLSLPCYKVRMLKKSRIRDFFIRLSVSHRKLIGVLW